MRYTLLLILACSCLPLNAKESIRPLIVALPEIDYPPYIINNGEKVEGLSINIINRLAQLTGQQLQFKKFPWSRALHTLKQGKTDLMVHLSKNASREAYIEYVTESYIEDYVHIITLQSNDIVYTGNLDCLTPFTIGVIRKVYYGEEFESNQKISKVLFNDERQLVSGLTRGSVDVILGNRFSLGTHAERLGTLKQLKILKQPIYIEPAFIGFSKKHPRAKELAMQFSNTIKKLKNTDYYRVLIEKYMSQYPAYSNLKAQ